MTQKQQTILAREYLMFLLLAAFPALVGLIAHLEDHAPIAVIVVFPAGFYGPFLLWRSIRWAIKSARGQQCAICNQPVPAGTGQLEFGHVPNQPVPVCDWCLRQREKDQERLQRTCTECGETIPAGQAVLFTGGALCQDCALNPISTVTDVTDANNPPPKQKQKAGGSPAG